LLKDVWINFKGQGKKTAGQGPFWTKVQKERAIWEKGCGFL